ncbi:MAG: HlyD family efflux transporter periplasmic adaptor subunit [bacterium]|nr:HlyD family efflux transporter periplasmic adaptor subunit [bacterium]
MKAVKIIILLVVMLLAAYLGMKVLSGMRKAPEKKAPKETKRFVKVEKVAYRDIESEVTGSGRIASTQQVDVISEVQGKILAGDVPLKKGQSFKKGTLLFRVHDGEARLNLLSRKSRFLNAIANLLPDFKVDYPGSYKNWTAFLGSIDIEKDLPSLPTINSTQEKIFLAGRNILSDYYSIKSDEVRLKKYAFYAPFTGTFLSVNLEAGSVANPGGRIGQIIRTDRLELEVPIEVENADWIKPGESVRVTTENGSREWTGRVARKSEFVDPRTQSISVFVRLESSTDNPLYLGIYLKAIFPGAIVKDAMEIPRNAVFNSNEVFIVKEGRLSKREVNVLKVDEKTLIFSGLDEGLDLVVEPLVNAMENTKAEIIKEKS